MAAYKLATMQTPGGPRAAVIVDGDVYDAAQLAGDEGYASVQGILDDWGKAHATLELAADDLQQGGRPLGHVELLAPIPRPAVIYCAGANYRDHAEEMAHLSGRPAQDPRAGGARPWFFLKSPRAVVSAGVTLYVTGYGEQIDWEAELVVVMGRKARNVSASNALEFVAGYTCGNDLSARDHVFRDAQPPGSPFRADWIRHKSFDDACPIGPWIVPAPYVPAPGELPVQLWVNDELKQDSSTANMIFTIAEQIAELSEGITLHPGDMIMTGTPAGVGASRGEFLKRGDVVRMEIGAIGSIENTIG